MLEELEVRGRLGKGGYGSVYKCVNKSGEVFAVKRLRNDQYGIKCLMEASIMSSIQHPHLNRAQRIYSEEAYTYFIMDLAEGDLEPTRVKTPPNIELVRKWSYQLVSALACLHQERIIHCDIKGANVLRYGKDVRLSDFTLAVRKWSIDSRYRHNICTCTHRPLEVFLGREWDESVDLWSLGCTLYEMAYGEVLFPYQGTDDDVGKDRSINCILDWARRYGEQDSPVEPRLTDFTPHRPSANWNRAEYRDFNRFLLRLLRLNPRERPKVEELFTDLFLRDFKKPSYEVCRLTLGNIFDSDMVLFENVARSTLEFSSSSAPEITLQVARRIYCSCNNGLVMAKNLRIITCLYIASKLVTRIPLQLGELQRNIINMEKLICACLQYRLFDLIE